MPVPHLVMQLAARDNLAGVKHKMLKKTKLHRCDIDFVDAARDASRQAIEPHIPDYHFADDGRATAAPQETSHEGAEFRIPDRGYDVSVRASIESTYDCLRIVEPRAQQHGGRTPGLPDCVKDLKPVAVGKIEVKDDSVVVVQQREHPGFISRTGNVDSVSVFRENPLHEGRI